MCLHSGGADWASIQIDLLHAEKLSYKAKQFSSLDCSSEKRNMLQKMICINELRAAAEKAKRQGAENSVSKIYFWCKMHCSRWREKWKAGNSNFKAEDTQRDSSTKGARRISFDTLDSYSVESQSEVKPLTASRLALEIPANRNSISSKHSFSSFASARSEEDSSTLFTDETNSTWDEESIGTPSTYYSNAHTRGTDESSFRSISSSITSGHFEKRYHSATSTKKPMVKLRALDALQNQKLRHPAHSLDSHNSVSTNSSFPSINPQEFLAFPLEKEVQAEEKELATTRIHTEQALKEVKTPVFAFKGDCRNQPLL